MLNIYIDKFFPYQARFEKIGHQKSVTKIKINQATQQPLPDTLQGHIQYLIFVLLYSDYAEIQDNVQEKDTRGPMKKTEQTCSIIYKKQYFSFSYFQFSSAASI